MACVFPKVSDERHLAGKIPKRASVETAEHRDLKPSNLFLPDGKIERVKLLDFGIARRANRSRAVTETGSVIGTPEYMAPEQARGVRDLSPAADIFSLGCLFYECLVGRSPFLADHVAAVLVRILFEDPMPLSTIRPGVSQQLEDLIGKMLMKDPARRISDADALLSELAMVGELTNDSGNFRAVASAPAQTPTETFAQHEQGLFCVVLATPPILNVEQPVAATMMPQEVEVELDRRRALSQSLSALSAKSEWLLDGSLVVTLRGLSNAQDQAAMAARAALRIKEQWPEAEVALCTGRGAVQGSVPVGEAADRAARLLGALTAGTTAQPGIWIDSLSKRLLERRFVIMSIGAQSVLTGEASEIDETRTLLGKPTSCVGREPALSALEGQLSGCISESEARAVLVTSPPGMGKSRLRHEFLRRVAARELEITIIEGRAELQSVGRPLGILSSALRRLGQLEGERPAQERDAALRDRLKRNLPDASSAWALEFLAELCGLPSVSVSPALHAARQDPKIMRDQTQRAISHFVAAECRVAPVLLVLDDLHWSDGLSIALIDEVLQELETSPLMVLALGRPEVTTLFPNLWAQRKLQPLPLPALSRKACERLVQQVLGQSASTEIINRLFDRSGGNPLFLEELVRAQAEGKEAEQAESVLAMLQARISGLSASARRAVLAASIFGQTFWAGGVAAVFGADRGDPEVEVGLKALQEAEIIQPVRDSQLIGETELVFRHALMREAAYSLLREEDQRMGHFRAAEYLERSQLHEPIVIGDHWQRAGASERALPYLMGAALEAAYRGDLNASLTFATRGLSCNPTGVQRGDLKAIQAQAYAYRTEFAESFAALHEALQLTAQGSRSWCMASFLQLGMMLLGSNLPMAVAGAKRFAAVEPDANALVSYVDGLGGLISVLGWMGIADMTIALKKRLEEIAALDPQHPLIQAWQLWSSCWRLNVDGGTFEEIEQTCAKAQSAYESIANHSVSGYVMMLRGQLRIATCAPAVAIAHLRNATAAAQQHQLPLVAVWGAAMLTYLLAGEPSGCAEAMGTTQFLLSNPVPEAIAGWLRGSLARAFLTQGQLAQAEQEARTAQSLLRDSPGLRLVADIVAAQSLLLQGRYDEALRDAEASLKNVAPNRSLSNMRTALRLTQAQAHDALKDRDAAIRILSDAVTQIIAEARSFKDAAARKTFLTDVVENASVRQLAQKWLEKDPYAELF